MKNSSSQEITQLLIDWGDGNKAALDELMPIVYEELRLLARYFMKGQSGGKNTLQTTVLVNEAYLRLVDSSRVNWKDRKHFFAIAAQLMRRVLVDFARKRQSQKRGGEILKVTIDEQFEAGFNENVDLVNLDEALKNLAEFDERQSKVVELRYFGGLSEKEIAETLDISVRTVRREWSLARAWLYRKLKNDDS